MMQPSQYQFQSQLPPQQQQPQQQLSQNQQQTQFAPPNHGDMMAMLQRQTPTGYGAYNATQPQQPVPPQMPGTNTVNSAFQRPMPPQMNGQVGVGAPSTTNNQQFVPNLPGMGNLPQPPVAPSMNNSRPPSFSSQPVAPQQFNSNTGNLAQHMSGLTLSNPSPTPGSSFPQQAPPNNSSRTASPSQFNNPQPGMNQQRPPPMMNQQVNGQYGQPPMAPPTLGGQQYQQQPPVPPTNNQQFYQGQQPPQQPPKQPMPGMMPNQPPQFNARPPGPPTQFGQQQQQQGPFNPMMGAPPNQQPPSQMTSNNMYQPGNTMPGGPQGLPQQYGVNQAPGMYNPQYPQQQQMQQQPMFDQNPYGQQPQQPQPQQKMDMDQVPNPIEVSDVNNTKYGQGRVFEADEVGKMPPLNSTDFICVDKGQCNPRFIRSSMYSVPNNPDILKQSKMPLVLTLTPFAQLRPEELEPPVSDNGEQGPVRCKRCKAYMGPFMQFIENGKRFQCPFCDDVTPVPQEYFNLLDHMGKRVDMYDRAEFCCGSYEFIANKDYCRKEMMPQPPAFIFMIDVSVNSIRSGLLNVLCPYIKNVILPNLPQDKQFLNRNPQQPVDTEMRVGFITYDKELHFYNLKSGLAAPQMMVVSDVEEVFVPILDGFLVKMSESRSVVESLLDALPRMFAENKETELLLGPVIDAGVEALKSAKLCGKLFVFHTNMPNAVLAPGHLKVRDDKKLLGTDKEKQLLGPQSDYYSLLGKRCVDIGCTVDLFLMPNQYCDVATLSELTRKTSGQIYKYDFFMAETHGERLCNDLRYAVEQTVAFDAVMKVRTSTGMKPVDYLGNVGLYGTSDIEMAGVSRGTSLCVELKHDDKMNENAKVYIQTALLYTSLAGQRRIRIHNLALSVCTQYAHMFSTCDLDVLINYMAKLACRSVLVSTPKSIRENLIQQVASILASYRKNCASSPARGQFILPETLKLLPIFSNSILKSDAISGAQHISTDDRSWQMYRLMSMNISQTYAYFYPRVIPVHDIVDPQVIPQAVRATYDRLSDTGIYLVENGLVMNLWLGANLDPNVVQNLFGVAGAAQQLNVEKCKLLDIDTPISKNLRSIIQLINEQRKQHLRLMVVRQRDSTEIFFKNYLVEDKGLAQNAMSYIDYLYHLHREIKTILSY